MAKMWVCLSSISIFTFSAFACNFGLQVVHLHLQAFKMFLLLTTTTATEVIYNDTYNDKYRDSTAHSNPNFNWNNFTLHLFEILKLAKFEI